MNRRILIFAALTLANLFPAKAQETTSTAEAPPPAIATTASDVYPPVSITSADALATADALQLASDTRDRLGPLLNLGAKWRFAVHIHIMTPEDPLLVKINREAAAVFAQAATMKIEAVVPPGDPNAREFIQRQFVTSLLWEKFFANTTTFDKNTHLDRVPFWLVEGLREWLNDDPEHNRERIVRRAVQKNSAPSLEEVTGWHELSTDRLLGLWQRAFSFYLVDSLTRQGPPREDFQQWLASFSGPTSSQAQLHFPTETAWQRELVDASQRSHDIVYTWAETLSEIDAAQKVTYAATKDAPVQTCTLDNLASQTREKALIEAVQEKNYALTELELRAHPSWHAILELYRSALTAYITDGEADQAKKLLDEATQQHQAETANHQKLLDYVNWFEVTKDNADDASRFETYFNTAKEMEKIEADPSHRNPIRANLLRIESQL